MRYSISYGTSVGGLMRGLGLGPGHSFIDVEDTTVEVRMGWAFSVLVPRSSIATVQQPIRGSISRGVHGFGGRWLVNGSGDGLVTMVIDPPVRARAVGVPIHVRELTVSTDSPNELEAILQPLG
jgi:hypothetical protein